MHNDLQKRNNADRENEQATEVGNPSVREDIATLVISAVSLWVGIMEVVVAFWYVGS